MTASVYLKIQNESQLQNYIQQTETPGSPNYHKFLSVQQFVSQYAPSNQEISMVTHYLQSQGITVDKVFADNLDIQVTGTVAQFNEAFNIVEENYTRGGKYFHAPKGRPRIPDVLLNSVLAIAGLSNEQAAQSLSITASQATGQQEPPLALPKDGSTATGIPGEYTVGDTANMYDINPLYQQGITGKGETIGIASLADFLPQDAYTYWNAIGLKTQPNRITDVPVDGGGALGAGTGETSLDVEQAGGLAPDANIIVYNAPNTDAGFLDLFYQAVSDNKVDTLSVSWGQPEIDYVAGMNEGTDYTNELQAFDQAFMEAAAQGISVFAASGDSGAYDTQRDFPNTDGFSTPLSVDAPASDPYVTAAGGTTVPYQATFSKGSVDITTERPWAWDYLQNLGYSTFSVGDGGGVSTIWNRPWYQQGIAGMQNTVSGQTFTDSQGLLYGSPFSYNLPSGFAGRNVADLSMDADPETGYLVYDTPEDGGWLEGDGGTSFVAPQLNGITALLDQDAHSRLGLLNPMLYTIMQTKGYGANAPFNDLADGSTNWYWKAVPGYDPAAGIGTPNVANLASAILALNAHGNGNGNGNRGH